MNEVTGRRRSSASFLIKILIVLIFPLVGVFGSPNTGWISILLIVGEGPIVAFTSIYSLLAGLFIMFPCLIFEQQLNSRPISKSIRGRAVAASILCWLISILLFPSGSIVRVDSFFLYVIMFTPILSIAFFVILPLISRESVMMSISKENHTLSYNFLTSNLRKSFRREKFLSRILWVALVFCPFMFYVALSWWSPQFQLMSLFYQFMVYTDFPMVIAESLFLNVSLQFTAMMGSFLPFIALLSALRFVFVRDVFRFQSGLIKKSRLASVALLGEILPSAAITLISLALMPPDSFIPVFFPLPILPIIGFAFIRFSKVVLVKEEIFPDYEYRMWFEKERDPYVPGVQEPRDETIKVPITYLLVSQIRKRLKD